MSTRILIIEDDPSIRLALEDNLRAQGWETQSTNDGEAGLQLIYDQPADLIILDIMLPGVNGYEICDTIRRGKIETPILMLTAKGQTEDVVRGLELGADDYLVKPFSLDILLARVRALLRRVQTEQTEYCFGEYTLDTNSRTLLKKKTEIPLTPKEFDLLLCFLRHAGRALSRERIIQTVWGAGMFITNRSVDRCVKTLRAKLDSEEALKLKTIRSIGYRWDG